MRALRARHNEPSNLEQRPDFHGLRRAVTAWRVTHDLGVRASGSVASILVLSLAALWVTLVPALFFLQQPAENFWQLGHDASWGLGLGGSERIEGLLSVVLGAGLGLLWAWVFRAALRWVLDNLRDLFGAHRYVEGTIERLRVQGRQLRRRWSVTVAGEELYLPYDAYRSLVVGQRVRLKVTRFNAEVRQVEA